MNPTPTKDKIKELEGDLFDAPDGAALIHACNCQGSWGKGIAKAFKENYPAAFAIYKSHCQELLSHPRYENHAESSRQIRLPDGTALIIPPQKRDYEGKKSKRHWIICLFTSRGFGKSVSPPSVILGNTELAVADMTRQLVRLEESDEISRISGLWSCRFNSGLFGVSWALTRKILEDTGLEVTVVRPHGE